MEKGVYETLIIHGKNYLSLLYLIRTFVQIGIGMLVEQVSIVDDLRVLLQSIKYFIVHPIGQI